MIALADLAKKYFAYETSDKSEFQRKARILQSIWREQQKYQIGKHINSEGKERELGSRLAMPWAKETLNNYLTENIRSVVRRELMVSKMGKLYSEPRIYDDLLSSQPLCFNLFAELKLNLTSATPIFSELTGIKIKSVDDIEFEYSPGRRNNKYTNDRTAFDVFIRYTTHSATSGFIGIEIKYHENLNDKPAKHKIRYEEIASAMGCFKESQMKRLIRQPLQQIWRDHLLAGSMINVGDYDEGLYIFLYPKSNGNCDMAVKTYMDCLKNTNTFRAWTLENIVDVIGQNTKEKWINDFFDRYLNFSKIEEKQLSNGQS